MSKKQEIKQLLNFHFSKDKVNCQILSTEKAPTFERHLIIYGGSENDEVRAYLFVPTNREVIGSVLVHHQHNGERHFGKSEVAGLVGDPFQHFCPALAKKGIASIAPDSICFEDRRFRTLGTTPDPEPDYDWLQHFNETTYRLLRGQLLMKKVVDDSAIALSILTQQSFYESNKLGILGHSYGGNTVLFHSPFDERITHSCTSGAACSFKTKMQNRTGIEAALVIPGFAQQFDVEDLLQLICPRKLLIVAGNSDPYAQNAKELYLATKQWYGKAGASSALQFKGVAGPHRLDQERFDAIIDWFDHEFRQI